MSGMAQRLARLARELGEQDRQLETARAQLDALGAVEVHVPNEVLEEIESACSVQAPGRLYVAAVRG